MLTFDKQRKAVRCPPRRHHHHPNKGQWHVTTHWARYLVLLRNDQLRATHARRSAFDFYDDIESRMPEYFTHASAALDLSAKPLRFSRQLFSVAKEFTLRIMGESVTVHKMQDPPTAEIQNNHAWSLKSILEYWQRELSRAIWRRFTFT